jgi:hypothetical protein
MRSFFRLSFLSDLDFLDGIIIAFAGADAQRSLNGNNENLAITNTASLRGGGDRFNNAVSKAVFHYNLKLYLRQEVDDIFCAAI